MLPTIRVTHPGIITDSNLRCLELHLEKLQQLAELVKAAAAKKIIATRFADFIGHMCFASRAVHGATTFTCVFIDALCKLRHSRNHTK